MLAKAQDRYNYIGARGSISAVACTAALSVVEVALPSSQQRVGGWKMSAV